MTADAEKLTSALLAELCAEQARPGRVGVFVENVPPLSIKRFVSELHKRAPSARLALLGGARPKSRRGVVLTTDPQEANQWRNDAAARTGTPTVVLAVGPATKLNSLRTAYPTIGTREIRRRVVARVVALCDSGERRAFWEAVERLPGEFPINRLLECATHLEDLSPAALVSREPAELARLGLLPTPRLLGQGGPAGARKELRRNLELTRKLRELSSRDRSRLVDMLDSQDTGDRETAAAILRFEGSGSDADLAALTFESVQAALRWRPPPPAARGDDDDDDDEVDEFEVDEPEVDSERDADAMAADILLFGDGDVGALSGAIEQQLEDEEGDDEVSPVSILGVDQSARARAGSREMKGLFGALLSRERWGGVIAGDERLDLREAVKRVPEGAVELEPFLPEESDGLVWTLRRAVKQGIAPQDALTRWERYSEARASLIPAIDQLVDRPVFALAADRTLVDRIDELLVAYQGALSAVQEVAEALAERSSIERSNKLYAQAICLDAVFFVSDAESKAIMSPLHPFHLWRSSALLEILCSFKDDLAALDSKDIQRLIDDAPLSAPNLVLTGLVSRWAPRPLHFMATSSLGAVPLYVEPTARSLGRFKSQQLARIADRFLRLSPHAALGLRVALVDPPSLVGALEHLTSLTSPSEGAVPLHVRVFRTRKTADETEADEERALLLAGEIREAGGSLALLEPSPRLEAIAETLERDPAHITAVFDPGEAARTHVGVAAPPLSPLSLPRTYRYDQFDDRIDVVVAGEIAPLARLHDFYCRVAGIASGEFLGRRSGVQQCERALERLARHTMWLTVLDQGIEPTIRLAGARKIDQRAEGGRDVVTFTAFAETIEDLVSDVARQAGLPTDKETVRQLQEQLFKISGEVTLMLSTSSSGLNLAHPRLAAAVVGVAAAARWYERQHPEALVISIDDDTSRRWILGHNLDNRRADLFGVRSTSEGVVVDVMEVKTHQAGEDGLAAEGGVIEGRAVSQVDQSVAVLAALLSQEHSSPVVRARADMLRDQLYRAVASRPYDAARRLHLVNMLEELFSSGVTAVNGLVFLVRLTHTPSGYRPSSPRPYSTPAGNRVGLVELEEGGAARPTRAAPRPRAKRTAERAEQRSVSEDLGSSPSDATSRPRVYIGDTHTGEEVYWDPQRPDRPLNNFGVLVTGDSGAGKTQVIRALIAGTRALGLPICVLDAKNDFSDEEFCAAAGLKSHDVNRHGLPFNPLSLVPDENGECQPIRLAHEVAGILRRVLTLGDQQESELRDAIAAAFAELDIPPKEWRQYRHDAPSPSFDDVVRILKRGKKNRALLNRLSRVTDLNLLPSDPSLSFERLLESRISLNLHALPDDKTKLALAEFIIVRIHSHVLRGEQPRELRRLLVLDEAWRLQGSVRLQELAREGRAFGVGLVVGTQFPGDIPDALAGNLETRLYLSNAEHEHRRSLLRALCGSTSNAAAKQYMKMIQALKKHEGFFHNQQHSPPVLVTTLPHYKRARGGAAGS